MNRPAVAQPESPDRTHNKIRLGAGAVVLGLLTVIALTLVVSRSAGPAKVARLTFENPTVYAIDIEVSPGTGTGWTPAGSVRQRSTVDVEEVTDQGDMWLFRFTSQGETGGELRLSRSELEGSGWRIVIPAEVGTRLADAGAPPTP
jgi:hypothetical protein